MASTRNSSNGNFSCGNLSSSGTLSTWELVAVAATSAPASTGPRAGTTCWHPDHSALRCYCHLDDLYPVTTADASLSFTLDSSASQCFFRDHTTVTPLAAPVPVALNDPTSRPADARSSTTLLCPAVPFGSLPGLYVPSFSRNLVGVGYLQDRGITVTFPAHGRTAICTDASTGAVLATFTREPHSILFVLHIPPPQIAASGQVVASCSCRSLTHPTALWHRRLDHPSLPHLRSMASQRLVSDLPFVFASLPPSTAPWCTSFVKGRLRATPHSSLRPTTAPFQTLCLDKSEGNSTLIRWLLATEDTPGSRYRCLHSDCGGEFRSDVLAGYCGEQGITQSWTLPESPQQNEGIPRPVFGPARAIPCANPGSEGVGAGGTPASTPSSPPHRHDTYYQAACRRAHEEQERQEPPQLDQQEQQHVQQEQQQQQWPQQQPQQQ
ncbi:unnamed protein product [Closterium sp. NIES-53]